MIELTPSTPRWMRPVARDLAARLGAEPSQPRVARTPRAQIGSFGRTAP